jgi:hypothetical protein
MKFSNLIFTISLFFSPYLYSQLGTETSTISSDPYSENSLSNGGGAGTGMGNWEVISAVSGWSGYYSTGSTAIGSAYGLWSKSSNTVKVRRYFNENMKKGDDFYITIGQTENYGTIGVNLINSVGGEVISLRLNGGQWQLNNGGNWFNTGQAQINGEAMIFKFTYDVNLDANTYSYTLHTHGVGANHAASNDISTIRGFEVYSYDQGDNQNFGFKDVSVKSKFTIDNNQTISCADSQDIPYLTIKSGSTLNITKNGTVKVRGDFSNAGTATLNSDSSNFGSILLSGTYSESGSGTIQYSRYIAGTDYWDLIGPPLSGYSVEDFVFDNNDVATNGSSPTTYAVGYYTNTSAASSSNGGWTNYTSDTYGTNLLSGKGYQMSTDGTATGAEVTFEGTLLTSNVTRTVTTNEAGNVSNSDGTKFELIANPYSSYISTTDFINAHKDTQLHASHAAVYGWDGTGYDTYNIAAPGNNIAPGQGFFIGVRGSAGTSQTITFTTAMQNTTGSGDYNEYDTMDNSAELFIQLSQNNFNKRTRIFFLPEGTDGLDIGYDAAGLDLGAYSIYTRLISDDEGLNMDIQTLNFDNMLGKVIPLGVNIEAGSEAEISILNSTINTDYYVYLEDSVTGAFIDLTEENYVINSDSNIEGVGRFFVHISADTMSNGEVSTSMLNAFKEIDASYITIEGLATQSNETKVSLYNILGREVLSTTLNNNMGTQTISTVGLSSGIYVIQLESGSDRLTKKLIVH